MNQPPLDPELAHLAEFDVGFGDDGIDLATIRASIDGLLEPPLSAMGSSPTGTRSAMTRRSNCRRSPRRPTAPTRASSGCTAAGTSWDPP